MLLKEFHDDMSHPGRDKMLAMLKRKYYYWGLKRDVEEYISFCEHCQKDHGRGLVPPLQPTIASYGFFISIYSIVN